MRSRIEKELGALQSDQAIHKSDVHEGVYHSQTVGKIGFIESITNPFCGDCSRAALRQRKHLHMSVRKPRP